MSRVTGGLCRISKDHYSDAFIAQFLNTIGVCVEEQDFKQRRMELERIRDLLPPGQSVCLGLCAVTGGIRTFQNKDLVHGKENTV